MILSIDPGITTGLAVRYTDGILRVSSTRSPEDLWRLIDRLALDAVVCESFATAGRISRYGLQTVRLIGSIQHACWQRSVRLVEQPPSFRYQQLRQATSRAPEGPA